MQSSAAGGRAARASVTVNAEHLQSMVEMGFPENRCRRALRYFNNDLETSI